jgi:hypothetical protein
MRLLVAHRVVNQTAESSVGAHKETARSTSRAAPWVQKAERRDPTPEERAVEAAVVCLQGAGLERHSLRRELNTWPAAGRSSVALKGCSRAIRTHRERAY